MFNKRKITRLWLFQFFADFTAIVCAYFTTLLIRFHSEIGEKFFTFVNKSLHARETGALDDMFESFYLESAPRIIILLLLTLCVLYALRDLYPGKRFLRKRPIAWNVIVANMLALAVFFIYFYLRRNIFHPRSFFVTVIFFNIIYCIWFRTIVDKFITTLRSRFSFDRSRAVMIGMEGDADFLGKLIDTTHPHGIYVADRIKGEPGENFEKMLGKLEESVSRHGADLIICEDRRFSVTQIMRILQVAERMDTSVKVLSGKMNVLMSQARIPVDIIQGIPLVHFEAPRHTNTGRAGRLFSILSACLILLVLLPLMSIITLLIRLTSHGPALFVQERIGVNRKPFMMYKFRTMNDKAEELIAQIEEFNESGAGLFKIRKDPRVTAVGRVLRRFSLDELPQLINVIRGEMMILGPRPLPRRDFENYYEEWHYSRHEGLPGLTCLWQVSGRSDIDFHNMCILDVYYLRNRNWILDLKIIIKTFWVVLFAKGAY